MQNKSAGSKTMHLRLWLAPARPQQAWLHAWSWNRGRRGPHARLRDLPLRWPSHSAPAPPCAPQLLQRKPF